MNRSVLTRCRSNVQHVLPPTFTAGANYNSLRRQQTELRRLLASHEVAIDRCKPTRRRQYVQKHIMKQMPNPPLVFDPATRDFVPCSEAEYTGKLMQKIRDKRKPKSPAAGCVALSSTSSPSQPSSSPVPKTLRRRIGQRRILPPAAVPILLPASCTGNTAAAVTAARAIVAAVVAKKKRKRGKQKHTYPRPKRLFSVPAFDTAAVEKVPEAFVPGCATKKMAPTVVVDPTTTTTTMPEDDFPISAPPLQCAISFGYARDWKDDASWPSLDLHEPTIGTTMMTIAPTAPPPPPPPPQTGTYFVQRRETAFTLVRLFFSFGLVDWFLCPTVILGGGDDDGAPPEEEMADDAAPIQSPLVHAVGVDRHARTTSDQCMNDDADDADDADDDESSSSSSSCGCPLSDILAAIQHQEQVNAALKRRNARLHTAWRQMVHELRRYEQRQRHGDDGGARPRPWF
jgi:hypothetical protein